MTNGGAMFVTDKDNLKSLYQEKVAEGGLGGWLWGEGLNRDPAHIILSYHHPPPPPKVLLVYVWRCCRYLHTSRKPLLKGSGICSHRWRRPPLESVNFLCQLNYKMKKTRSSKLYSWRGSLQGFKKSSSSTSSSSSSSSTSSELFFLILVTHQR